MHMTQINGSQISYCVNGSEALHGVFPAVLLLPLAVLLKDKVGQSESHKRVSRLSILFPQTQSKCGEKKARLSHLLRTRNK